MCRLLRLKRVGRVVRVVFTDRCVVKVLVGLLWARPSFDPFVTRNPWVGAGTVLVISMWVLDVVSALVVTSLVGFVLTISVLGVRTIVGFVVLLLVGLVCALLLLRWVCVIVIVVLGLRLLLGVLCFLVCVLFRIGFVGLRGCAVG